MFYLNRYNKNRFQWTCACHRFFTASQVFYSFTGFLYRYVQQIKNLFLYTALTGGFYYYDLNIYIQNLYSSFIFTKIAAQKGKARMEAIEGFVNFVYFINFWTRE